MGVLEGERQAVQRPHVRTGRERLVSLGGTGPGALLVERHDRVQLRVALPDPVQVQVEQLARRDLATTYGVGLVARGRLDRDRHRRPKRRPTTTPSTTRPAPTAMPLRKSSWEEIDAFAGAVKTPGVSTGSTTEEDGPTAGASMAWPTLPKNSPAIRFETLVSIRCPTPPTMPPT